MLYLEIHKVNPSWIPRGCRVHPWLALMNQVLEPDALVDGLKMVSAQLKFEDKQLKLVETAVSKFDSLDERVVVYPRLIEDMVQLSCAEHGLLFAMHESSFLVSDMLLSFLEKYPNVLEVSGSEGYTSFKYLDPIALSLSTDCLFESFNAMSGTVKVGDALLARIFPELEWSYSFLEALSKVAENHQLVATLYMATSLFEVSVLRVSPLEISSEVVPFADLPISLQKSLMAS